MLRREVGKFCAVGMKPGSLGWYPLTTPFGPALNLRRTPGKHLRRLLENGVGAKCAGYRHDNQVIKSYHRGISNLVSAFWLSNEPFVYCRTNEGNRRKCGQYWPLEEGGQEVYGHMAVVNQRVDHHAHHNHTTLVLHNTEVQSRRSVTAASWGCCCFCV